MEINIKEEFQYLLERLKNKYEEYDLLDDDFVETIEFAVTQYIRLTNDPDLTELDTFAHSWIRRACYESLDRILKLGIVGGVKQYSENGYSFTLDGVEISSALANEIVPKVGYPR